jgi:hypothetical protein
MVDTPELATRIVRAMNAVGVIANASNWTGKQMMAEAQAAMREVK